MEEEIAFVKVQRRKAGAYMVTIPKEVVEKLKLEGARLKVLIDLEKRRVIYQA